MSLDTWGKRQPNGAGPTMTRFRCEAHARTRESRDFID